MFGKVLPKIPYEAKQHKISSFSSHSPWHTTMMTLLNSLLARNDNRRARNPITLEKERQVGRHEKREHEKPAG
jgi:hypothetical protein